MNIQKDLLEAIEGIDKEGQGRLPKALYSEWKRSKAELTVTMMEKRLWAKKESLVEGR